MEGYETEEQQWEAIKGWFNKHGNKLTWAIIIVCSIFLAGRYFLHHNQNIKEQASEHYFSMIKSEEENDLTSMESKALRLVNEYSKTPYAQVASLMLAKYAVSDQNFDEAISRLQWVIDKGPENDLKKIARIRLMKVYMAQGKLDEANALFDKEEANGWLTLMQEIKGDVYTQKNKSQDALEAYKAAILAAPEEAMHGPLLTLKLNDLGLGQDELEQLKEQKAKS